MNSSQLQAFVEMFRSDPATSSLLLGGPLIMACGQLLNSYLNGVSIAVSLVFAVVMVAFAIVATRHHAAEHRLRRLESGIDTDLESEFGSTR